MNVLKRASAHSTAAFGLPILLSGAILVAPVRAADKMVGGDFATKGIVTSTVGPNDAKGQPASVLTFTDDEVKKLHDGHYSAALLFQTSSDWADAVTRGAQDEFKTLGVEIAGLSNSNFSASDQAHAVQTIMAKKPSGIVTWPINRTNCPPRSRRRRKPASNSH
jgi:ABC-type sugar transport system substrate-binding protein